MDALNFKHCREHVEFLYLNPGAVPRGHGGGGAKASLKISKTEKMKKYGVLSCVKVIKISFSVILNKEIRALERLLSRF